MLPLRRRTLAVACSLLVFLAAGRARADVLLSDNFNSGALDPAKWTTNTNIDRGPAGVQVIDQRVALTNRGHLITAAEFNPLAVGPLEITGSYVFGRSGLPGGDFLQILTRSDGLPNNANFGETTNGIEFFANANGNSIEIASRVNGGGDLLAFLPMPLNAGETYAFDARDDGHNLSFTMTELGGAQLSETISATSDLVFGQNYVVFHNRESNNGGFDETSYLDDVVISGPSAVPEPASLTLLGVGGISLWWGVRRRSGN